MLPKINMEKAECSKIIQREYEKIFMILEPILTKIVNEEKLSNSDIEDIKAIRNQIKFKIQK